MNIPHWHKWDFIPVTASGCNSGVNERLQCNWFLCLKSHIRTSVTRGQWRMFFYYAGSCSLHFIDDKRKGLAGIFLKENVPYSWNADESWEYNTFTLIYHWKSDCYTGGYIKALSVSLPHWSKPNVQTVEFPLMLGFGPIKVCVISTLRIWPSVVIPSHVFLKSSFTYKLSWTCDTRMQIEDNQLNFHFLFSSTHSKWSQSPDNRIFELYIKSIKQWKKFYWSLEVGWG